MNSMFDSARIILNYQITWLNFICRVRNLGQFKKVEFAISIDSKVSFVRFMILIGKCYICNMLRLSNLDL